MANYGTDISTFAAPSNAVGLDPLMPLISGSRVVLEAVARRYMTPRGSLPQGPARNVSEYGYDLMSLVAKRMTQVAILRAKADIEAEAEKEAGVLKATLVEFLETSSNVYRVRITIELATGPFPLVLSVSAVTVAILQAA